MQQTQEQLNALQEIRDIMNRTAKFVSLSGLSGISAGISALAGTVVVYTYLSLNDISYTSVIESATGGEPLTVMAITALAVLTVSFFTAAYFTARNAHRRQSQSWNALSRRLLWNLLIPLATGGAFCAILGFHNLIFLIPPAMLVFYGLALLNSSKYTFDDIRSLSFIEILLGLIAAAFPKHGLLLWALGFGVLHVVYGTIVYFKYER